MADILLDDDGNEIEKRKPGRPPGPQNNKKVNLKGKSGPVRLKTDINHEDVKEVFSNLKKVGSNPNPFSIAKLICSVVTADIKNLMPGDVVTRTQKSIEILNDISEDMIYTSGGAGVDDDLPAGLDEPDIKQIESKDVTDKIINSLPEEEIQLEEEKEEGESINIGNEEGKITEEAGII